MGHHIKRVQTVLFGFAIAITICSCGSNKPQNDVPAENAVPVAAIPPAKQAFINNCIQCHAVDKDKTCPKLGGVIGRWDNDTAGIITYVKNSQAVIQGGKNPRITKLYHDWHETIMPPFPSLSDDDIRDIIIYVNAGVE